MEETLETYSDMNGSKLRRKIISMEEKLSFPEKRSCLFVGVSADLALNSKSVIRNRMIKNKFKSVFVIPVLVGI